MAYYECAGKTQTDIENAYNSGYQLAFENGLTGGEIPMIDGDPVRSDYFLLDTISSVSVPIKHRGDSGWGVYLDHTQYVYIKDTSGNILAQGSHTTSGSTNGSNWIETYVDISTEDLVGMGRIEYSVGTGQKSWNINNVGWISLHWYSTFGGSPAKSFSV